jgi:hypothetical protein
MSNQPDLFLLRVDVVNAAKAFMAAPYTPILFAQLQHRVRTLAQAETSTTEAACTAPISVGTGEGLRAALERLRIDANRLCDRNRGGSYEADCRASIAFADAALADYKLPDACPTCGARWSCEHGEVEREAAPLSPAQDEVFACASCGSSWHIVGFSLCPNCGSGDISDALPPAQERL